MNQAQRNKLIEACAIYLANSLVSDCFRLEFAQKYFASFSDEDLKQAWEDADLDMRSLLPPKKKGEKEVDSPAGECNHEAWEDRNGTRVCADCKLYLGTTSMKDAHGTCYEPWQDGDMIGLKATKADGSISYIYFNPSDEDSDGKSNLFVYQGTEGDPNYDNALFYVLV